MTELIANPSFRTVAFHPQRVALLSGTATRWSGDVQPTTSGWRNGDVHWTLGGWKPSQPDGLYAPQLLEGIFAAGDLDGDGADDMISWSGYYGILPHSDEPDIFEVPSLNLNRDGEGPGRFNVHYGKLDATTAPVR